jgi:hypothetical protein
LLVGMARSTPVERPQSEERAEKQTGVGRRLASVAMVATFKNLGAQCPANWNVARFLVLAGFIAVTSDWSLWTLLFRATATS